MNTPDPSLYRAARWTELTERVLARTWHAVARIDEVPAGTFRPVTLLPGGLDEPVLLTHDGELRAFANVCTHRSALLCDSGGSHATIRCPYHGRQFDLSGRCKSAPGFTELREADDLAPISLATWGPLIFVSIDPATPFSALCPPNLLNPLWNPAAKHDPAGDTVYEIKAHFLLWCENFLEGFHIPFVHPALNRAIDWRSYETRPAAWSSIQLAPAQRRDSLGGDAAGPGGASASNSDASATADGPSGTAGPSVTAAGHEYSAAYIALFPTTALNFYPWGVSINIVEPVSPTHTRIRYQRFVHSPQFLNIGPGAGLEAVEAEDDEIVERVQRGISSRLARPGKFAEKWELGVEHFHAGISALLGG